MIGKLDSRIRLDLRSGSVSVEEDSSSESVSGRFSLVIRCRLAFLNILTWKRIRRIRRIRLYGESEVQNLEYCTSRTSLVLMPTQHRLASSTEQIERNGAMSKTIRQKVEYDSFKTRSLTTRQSFKHTYTTHLHSQFVSHKQPRNLGHFCYPICLLEMRFEKRLLSCSENRKLKKKFSLSFKK